MKPPSIVETLAQRALEKLINEGLLARSETVLTVCAADMEHRLFQRLGFSNVTISNLDPRAKGDEFAPFAWSFQDAEALTFPDASFDWVFVHAGLHHCASPHRGLLEMYRVARKGVIVIEARDSLGMRAAVKLGLTTEHEIEAVILNGMEYGGWRNTPLPNHVYRWTEHEFKKAINSWNPIGPHTFRFVYGLRLPHLFAGMYKNPLKKWALRAVAPFYTGITYLFPKLRNHFTMVAVKPNVTNGLFPWVEHTNGSFRLSRSYVAKNFKPRA